MIPLRERQARRMETPSAQQREGIKLLALVTLFCLIRSMLLRVAVALVVVLGKTARKSVG